MAIRSRSTASGAAIALLLLICADNHVRAQTAPPANLFAPTEDTALWDPDNPTKEFRIDLARVEHEFPLSRADLMKITPDNIKALSQEQVDQIYGRITAGPIPNGLYQGKLFFERGDDLRPRLEEILGGIAGRLAGANIKLAEILGGALWKGKVFNREQRVLRNMIVDTALLEMVTGDPTTVRSITVPREGFLGHFLPGKTVKLLFPAKLYCGQSLLDARRESVIVDYNYSDDIDGYRASPDSLAGRGGLRIRDEIRMVRPGFYLGRAYANRFLLLNFTLYSSDVADRDGASFAAGGAVAEDCWIGEQARRAAVR